MKVALLLLAAMLPMAAVASINVASSSGASRASGVPTITATTGTFTVCQWVTLAASPSGDHTSFSLDDGGTFAIYASFGTASDSPADPFYITPSGEYHFNKNGTYNADPSNTFDVTAGWTFLCAVVSPSTLNLYAWQSGVNSNALVTIATGGAGTLGGSGGTISTLVVGNESTDDEAWLDGMGPTYIWTSDLTSTQIDAQRKQVKPLVYSGLIYFSPWIFTGNATKDYSGNGTLTKTGTISAGSLGFPKIPWERPTNGAVP